MINPKCNVLIVDMREPILGLDLFNTAEFIERGVKCIMSDIPIFLSMAGKSSPFIKASAANTEWEWDIVKEKCTLTKTEKLAQKAECRHRFEKKWVDKKSHKPKINKR